jgi:hypothetical protein
MSDGWGTTRYTGVAKGSLSKELAVVGRVAVVSAVQHTCFKLVVGGLLCDVKGFISVAGHCQQGLPGDTSLMDY